MRLTPQAKAARRANARKSSGPKSDAGKSRVARNALAHGLSIPLGLLPNAKERIEALAEALLVSLGFSKSDASAWHAACSFTEAQLDCERIRSMRHDALTRAIIRHEKAPKAEFKTVMSRAKATKDFDQMLKMVDTLSDGRFVSSNPPLPEKYKLLSSLLQSFDRYERRAISRRKKALRLLSELQSTMEAPNPIGKKAS